MLANIFTANVDVFPANNILGEQLFLNIHIVVLILLKDHGDIVMDSSVVANRNANGSDTDDSDANVWFICVDTMLYDTLMIVFR